MKAAIFRGQREIEVADVPMPSPAPGEVLIKVHYCGICGSDVDAYETGMYESGLIIGHEMSGEIVAVGPPFPPTLGGQGGVVGWEVGDRVTVNGVIPCGDCYFCHHGQPSLCENLFMTGVSHNGAFAEYLVAPAKGVYRLPDSVSLLRAALIDPLADALHMVRLSALKVGDRVLVMGAGPIGLMTIQCARLAGARAVFASEISPERSQLARQVGAEQVFNPLTDNLFVQMAGVTERRGPDIIFVCAGVPAAIRDAITLARKGGQIVLVGLCEEPVDTDFMTVVLNELDIKGGYCGYEEYPMALDYVAQGRVQVEPLISKVISLDQIVKEGFAVLATAAPTAVKIIVKL